jgi:hypothetical protein
MEWQWGFGASLNSFRQMGYWLAGLSNEWENNLVKSEHA